MHLFDVGRYELVTGADGMHPLQTKATVTLLVLGQEHSATASDQSPVGALAACIRNCLDSNYPQIRNVHMTDYKVRLLSSREGETAKVRVLVNWTANHEKWSTVGVSHSVVEASWNALLDAVRLQLMRLTEKAGSIETPAQTA
jgi:2-isopropylmalate synthase